MFNLLEILLYSIFLLKSFSFPLTMYTKSAYNIDPSLPATADSLIDI